MKRFFLMMAAAVLLMSCGGEKKPANTGMSNEQMADYKQTLEQVQRIEQQLDGVVALEMTAEQAISLNNLAQQLYYDYDPMGLDESAVNACESLKTRVNRLRPQLLTLIEASLPLIPVEVVNNNDLLIEQTTVWPVYLKRGDTLRLDVRTEHPATLTLLNADARQTVKALTGKSQYSYVFPVQNAAIYLVELNPGTKAQYAEVHVCYSAGSMERLQHPVRVKQETVEAKAGDWRATKVSGVEMRNLFEEPRKFTLRGQLKAAFSGSAKALVALQIPAGATDVMYSLRIATNEADRSQDGKFYDNMCTSYKRIKFLGLPLYDRQGGSGLLSTLLGDNQPLREEDAYINMYVFYNAAQAKKFQDGKSASELQYSVDYSTLGTQSCNGRIPSKGNKTIYLAFENERMRYNNYVWLEAVSAVPHAEYYRTKYTLVD